MSTPGGPSSTVSSASCSNDQDEEEDVHRKDDELIINDITLPYEPGYYIIDPFDSFPSHIGGNNNNAILAKHYGDVFQKTATPVDPKEEWSRMAFSDPAVFHATLLLSAYHIELLGGPVTPRSALLHQGEALALINKKLVDLKQATSDETLAAIALLAMLETVNGQIEISEAHLAGMRQIMNIRGGIGALGLNNVVRRLITWVDIRNCIILGRKPTLESLMILDGDPETLLCPPSQLTAAYGAAFGQDMYALTGDLQLSSHVAKIYRMMRSIEELKPMRADDDLSDIYFNDKTEVLIGIIMSLLEKVKASIETSYFNHVFSTFGTTCIIYIHFIQDLPMTASFFNVLGMRLKAMLESVDWDIYVRNLRKMTLWMLSWGGKSVRHINDKSWFARQTAGLLLGRNELKKEDVMAALDEFVWPEKLLEREYPYTPQVDEL